jgi:hypothetical protein
VSVSHEPREPRPEMIEQGHEEIAVDVTGVVRTVAGLLLLLAGTMALCWFLIGGLAPAPDPAVADRAGLGRVEPRGPDLDPDQPAIRRRLRREQLERLTTYGWVDAEAGIARVPIDAAIDELVERGIAPPQPTEPESSEPESNEDGADEDGARRNDSAVPGEDQP